jgi:hypothetical protein
MVLVGRDDFQDLRAFRYRWEVLLNPIWTMGAYYLAAAWEVGHSGWQVEAPHCSRTQLDARLGDLVQQEADYQSLGHSSKAAKVARW